MPAIIMLGASSSSSSSSMSNGGPPPMLPSIANPPDEAPPPAIIPACYLLRRAQRSSRAIQRGWIRSVLHEAAAGALRNLVVGRRTTLLRQRREAARAAAAAARHRYDDASISSIEEEPTEGGGAAAGSAAYAKRPNDDGDEIVVTQEDVDAAYAFAERVGRKWADCLRGGREGHDALPSSADVALEVVRAGKFLEEEEPTEGGSSAKDLDTESVCDGVKLSADAVADESVAAAVAQAPMEVEDTATASASESASILSNLAKPSDAITPEVAISRLTTPPALLIGNSPFGTLAEEIPPNPVLSASLVTTMLHTSADEIKAKKEKADAWRRNVGQQMGQLIEKQRWLYPKDLLDKTVQHNRERMASSRVGASTTANIASGRAIPSSAGVAAAAAASADANGSNDSEPSVGSGKKRRRSEMDERANSSASDVPILPRRPCPYSELEWTGCELSKEQQTKLDQELLHEIPGADREDDGSGGEQERIPPPLPPSCIVSGHLQQVGSVQQWEKAGARGIKVRESDPMHDLRRAKRGRKRLYRQSKTERLSHRIERPNDARLEINARLSKVVKATDGEKEEDEAPEYFEMDLGGCLLEIEADDGTQKIVTFKSLEVSLSLNAEGNA